MFLLKTGEEHIFMVPPGPCPLLIICELSSPLLGQNDPSPPLQEAGASFPYQPTSLMCEWEMGRSWVDSTWLLRTIMLFPFSSLSLSLSLCNAWESSHVLPLFEGGQRRTQSCNLPPLQQQEKGLTSLRRRITRTERNRIAGKGQMWALIIHFLMSDAFNHCWR